MKQFKKAALVCGLMASAGVASAETVKIMLTSGGQEVKYSTSGVVIEGGVITLNNGSYQSGTIPGSGVGQGYTCDPATTTVDPNTDTCVGSGGNPADYCGDDSVFNPSSEMCEGVASLGPAPEVSSFTSSKNSLFPGGTATISVSFSESVTGFSGADITANHGVIGAVQGSGSTYTARYTADATYEGSVTITIANNSYQDVDGQDGSGDTLTLNVIEDNGGTDTCDVPGNVVMTNDPALTSFGLSGGQLDFVIPQTDILSAPISTGNNPDFAGIFEMVGYYKYQAVTRKMWISECPGGDPVKSCAAAVGADLSWRWGQGHVGWGYCNMGTSGSYYINVKHLAECPSSAGCKATIQVKTSKELDL
jgi:hypothetical protein